MQTIVILFAIFWFMMVIVSGKPKVAYKANQHIQFTRGKIIGGQDAPAHEFPWQISLRYLGQHNCGGSIINQNQVLTAAHCVDGGHADSIVAGAQHLYFEGNHQKRNIKHMEAHINFDSGLFNDDIGIITVDEPFDFSDPHVQPIDWFKEDDSEIQSETVCNSTGWGVTFSGGLFPSNTLQWIQIPTHGHENCQNIFPDVAITDGMFCAGSTGQTTCNGDSGGPLVCPDINGNRKLAGLVSFGYTGCIDAAVFTKVSYYDQWIQEHTYL